MRNHVRAGYSTQEASSLVTSGGKILLVMSMKCSGLTQPKDKKKHIDHMFTPLIFVLYTVVQCIVGCILYNKQIVWPWTLCFPFGYSTDCSIDFDWLQVHINKEQELQYHRNKRQVCEHVFIHQKTKTEKYEICFEIKNVLLPELYVLNNVFSIFGVCLLSAW